MMISSSSLAGVLILALLCAPAEDDGEPSSETARFRSRSLAGLRICWIGEEGGDVRRGCNRSGGRTAFGVSNNAIFPSVLNDRLQIDK